MHTAFAQQEAGKATRALPGSAADRAVAAAAAPWVLSRRAERMNPSILREILKVTERPGILSMAGGLPSPNAFPVAALRDAAQRVLTAVPQAALQYAASEGHGPLREWVAGHLGAQGLAIDADQVLITNGSQQGLDLVAKVLVDSGSVVAVEDPTYLGALQAFAPMEPRFRPVACDEHGPMPDALASSMQRGNRARFMYVLPNFQNPTGRVIPAMRRQALVEHAQRAGVPLIEDNPYGDLWYDEPPPPPMAALWPEGVIHLGSFSKVLAPGLRLGYVAAPRELYSKLLQAKQAADLHTSGFTQRIVAELLRDGFLPQHVAEVRAMYRRQRDAMAAALACHLPAGSRWQVPRGGMFFWVRLPEGLDAAALLDRAVAAGVAYVPGSAFFTGAADVRTLRLSFVTLNEDEIDEAVARLGRVLSHAVERMSSIAP